MVGRPSDMFPIAILPAAFPGRAARAAARSRRGVSDGTGRAVRRAGRDKRRWHSPPCPLAIMWPL